MRSHRRELTLDRLVILAPRRVQLLGHQVGEDVLVDRAVMHAEPGASWTIDRLARDSSLSRATLTRRFAALVGEPRLAYLTRWRMELAARALRETDDAVSAIGHRVGYTSEFAFSRAFSRHRGLAPGRYRLESRTARRDQ